MSIAINADHSEFQRVVHAFLEAHEGIGAARTALEASSEELPDYWKAMADLGWFGVHLPEDMGGSGYGLPELGLILEELGRYGVPGPFLPSVLASAVIARTGTQEQWSEFLPTLADGGRTAAVGLGGSLTRDADGLLHGDGGLVLGGGLADLLLLCVGDELCAVDRHDPGLQIEVRSSLDPTRRVASVRAEGVSVSDSHVFPGAKVRARRIAWTMIAAEAAGGARACTEMAAEYSKVRHAFGRPIGMFQAVKHHCANMLVQAEAAAAVAWDANRVEALEAEGPLASATAASVALRAFLFCAETNIQVHGGIGFTWEHDAHLYLRRALTLIGLFGPVETADEAVIRHVLSGSTRTFAVELPPEAESIRSEVRAFIERYLSLPEHERIDAWNESGYQFPHWPKPWGREAGPIEQLVIEQEFADFPKPTSGIGMGAWVLPNLMVNGTPDQRERWIPDSLTGKITWCQLFSEPDVGSDLAGLTTRATRTDGGWLVTGQKIWNSGAHSASHGLALVRTDPSAEKHRGISAVIVDMHHVGVEVYPLREITGNSAFSQVFLNEVFVPDENVVGEVNNGWLAARMTLSNERVAGFARGWLDHEALLELGREAAARDVAIGQELGRIMAESYAVQLMGVRNTTRRAAGQAGPESSLTKLLSTEHDQRAAALALRLLSEGAALTDGKSRTWIEQFLFARGITIAGGTSEIQRNLIGEQLLGLPRDRLVQPPGKGPATPKETQWT
jgi:alkylation response protein AidB-like acyl-CoA dehydrogenase